MRQEGVALIPCQCLCHEQFKDEAFGAGLSDQGEACVLLRKALWLSKANLIWSNSTGFIEGQIFLSKAELCMRNLVAEEGTGLSLGKH